jgi:DNA processing protein
MPDLLSAIALAFVSDVGCVAYRALVERYGSAATAFAEVVPQRERAAALDRAADVLRNVHRVQARVLVLGEPDYPDTLLDLRDPPPYLFALGDPNVLGATLVGIVGTRHASQHGERAAHRLAAALARAGVCVVSGMARGIDAAAHRGALAAGGTTAALLGGGVDVVYPRMHRALHHAIISRGVVLSEALPGVPPLPGAFPKRNRLIAALSRAVIVVEAGERSGALITSDHALALGRAVAGVPGPIDSPQTVGSNALLREGANIVASPEDALLLAGLSSSAGPSRAIRARPDDSLGGMAAGLTARTSARAYDACESAILEALNAGAATVSSLAHHTGLGPRDITMALTALELTGAIASDHMGEVRLAPCASSQRCW